VLRYNHESAAWKAIFRCSMGRRPDPYRRIQADGAKGPDELELWGRENSLNDTAPTFCYSELNRLKSNLQWTRRNCAKGYCDATGNLSGRMRYSEKRSPLPDKKNDWELQTRFACSSLHVNFDRLQAALQSMLDPAPENKVGLCHSGCVRPDAQCHGRNSVIGP
jgi:hypothetical protein